MPMYPGQLPPEYYAGPTDPLVSTDFGGWWARSFRLAQAAWRPVALVQLLLTAGPLFVLTLLGLFVDDPTASLTFGAGDKVDWSEVRALLAVLVPIVLVLGLLTLVASLATQRILVQTAIGRPVSIGAALLDGLRRTPALIGWSLLAALLVLVGLVFCIVPGIYVAIVMTILPVVVLLERGNAIGRTFRLFHADFGAALGRIIVYGLMTLAFAIVETLITGALDPSALSSTAAASTAGDVVSALVSAVFSVATGVLLSPMLLTAYADMRARHEPFSTAYLVPGN